MAPAMRASNFEPFVDIDPTIEASIDSALDDRRDGKVRMSWRLNDGRRLIVTTDRLSAFDRILAGVTYKGQVLNQLAAFWFDATDDIITNHVISLPDPNALVAIDARPLPVEVVVRGAITGVTDTSLWGIYASGARSIYGYDFPDGITKNSLLPTPIITPTTKAQNGGHDEPLSCTDVVERGLVDPDLWHRVTAAAQALFVRGQEIGHRAGLILADTKYEFGVADGDLLLIDEVHTPDSSRWWVADTFDERIAAGDEPESLDKEVVRRAYADLGYKGNGPIPSLPAEVWSATSARYIDAFERLTGRRFEPGTYPVPERLAANLSAANIL